MHIGFLVEELSTQEFLLQVLPKIFAEKISYKIHPFRGKIDLLKKLPSRMRGYKSWLPDDHKIVVLIDRDDDDCIGLKQKLENIAKDCGFITKSMAKNNQNFQVLNRIAIEELEAWFFGDVNAITQAYPTVSKNLDKKEPYRYPDAIKGGTWEALERVLQKAGYHKGGLEKIKAAREIGLYLNPQNNSSSSFQMFYQGLIDL